MLQTKAYQDLNIELDAEQKRILALLLQDCSSIQNNERRGIVVQDLQSDFKISIIQSADRAVHVRHIIDACIQYNGFGNLINAMRQFDNETLQLKKVQKFIDDVDETAYKNEVNVRKKGQYDALNAILPKITDRQLEKVDLEQIYNDSIPDNIADKWCYPKISDPRTTLTAVIEQLKGAVPQKGGLHANQKLIINLALQLPKRAKAQVALDNWIESTVEPWRTDKQKISEFRGEAEQKWQQRKTTKSTPSLVQPPHLLIKLEIPKDVPREKVQCDKLDVTNFSVMAWLFYGKNDMECIHVPDELYSSAKMPGLLAALLARAEQSTRIDDTLKRAMVIDFFLEHDFFALPVERWTISEKSTIAIGKDHPVVIRSLERLCGQRGSLWNVKWGQVRNPPTGAEIKHIYWLYDRDKLSHAVLEDNLLPDHITCLGIMFVPLTIDDPRSDATPFYSLLYSLTTTGTPVALWPRELPAPEDLDKLKDLINLLLGMVQNHVTNVND